MGALNPSRTDSGAQECYLATLPATIRVSEPMCRGHQELRAKEPEASQSVEQEIWDGLAMSDWDAGVRMGLCVLKLA